MVCHLLTYAYLNVILKCFSGRLSFPDLSGCSSGAGGRYVTVVTVQKLLWGWVVQWGNGTVTL